LRGRGPLQPLLAPDLVQPLVVEAPTPEIDPAEPRQLRVDVPGSEVSLGQLILLRIRLGLWNWYEGCVDDLTATGLKTLGVEI